MTKCVNDMSRRLDRASRKHLRSLVTALIVVPSLTVAPAFAQEAKGGDSKDDHGDLTTKATNPVL